MIVFGALAPGGASPPRAAPMAVPGAHGPGPGDLPRPGRLAAGDDRPRLRRFPTPSALGHARDVLVDLDTSARPSFGGPGWRRRLPLSSGRRPCTSGRWCSAWPWRASRGDGGGGTRWPSSADGWRRAPTPGITPATGSQHFPLFATMHVVTRWRFMAMLGVALAAASVLARWRASPRPALRYLALASDPDRRCRLPRLRLSDPGSRLQHRPDRGPFPRPADGRHRPGQLRPRLPRLRCAGTA